MPLFLLTVMVAMIAAVESDSDRYTCSGHTMRVTSEGAEDEYRRR